MINLIISEQKDKDENNFTPIKNIEDVLLDIKNIVKRCEHNIHCLTNIVLEVKSRLVRLENIKDE